ncbi:hypothetical protein M427DRAFT_61251 [Gonapodya prolifera JEL478]|uniref:Uncharacterized protein n=1 Tax=Gonapodya prolifera (strain JEL478) TaxID=1344416 RepID=A0A139A2N0_GONPJ|nr:hypothetical protein M427DRAFT_61251 [Gonapodya prolifera JEL478]|eukprot:KXS11040.1 hypothetical protein M427DRAFT_61251 [Gonapodya prolifera JEL478]
MPFSIRCLLILGRSVLFWKGLTSDEQKALESFYSSRRFFFDALYIHEPPGAPRRQDGRIGVQEIFYAILELSREESYIAECSRNPRSVSAKIATFLGHPMQRPKQLSADLRQKPLPRPEPQTPPATQNPFVVVQQAPLALSRESASSQSRSQATGAASLPPQHPSYAAATAGNPASSLQSPDRLYAQVHKPMKADFVSGSRLPATVGGRPLPAEPPSGGLGLSPGASVPYDTSAMFEQSTPVGDKASPTGDDVMYLNVAEMRENRSYPPMERTRSSSLENEQLGSFQQAGLYPTVASGSMSPPQSGRPLPTSSGHAYNTGAASGAIPGLQRRGTNSESRYLNNKNSGNISQR